MQALSAKNYLIITKLTFIKMVKITKSLSFMASAACLSTMLFMSSCSKDDAAMPSPEATISKIESAGGSNLKINGLEIIQPTIGQPGLGSLPVSYTIDNSHGPVSQIVGLSTSQGLFGNPLTPWIPAINRVPMGTGRFLTLGAAKGKTAVVNIAIKNLVANKKYKFTYFVSTLTIKKSLASGHTPYAKDWFIGLWNMGQGKSLFFKKVHLANQENRWITQTDEFITESTVDNTIALRIALTSDSNSTSYGNIFIPEGAVQEVK